MYGCFDTIIVYGWCEESYDTIIDEDWIIDNYPDIGTYAYNIINHCLMGKAVYGVLCKLDISTGKLTIDNNEKIIVEELFSKVIEYIKTKYPDRIYPMLGYYPVIYGNYKIEHETYTLEH